MHTSIDGGLAYMTRVELFGIAVDAVREHEAVERILRWIKTPDGRLHYVVTPNVQHTLVYQQNEEFRAAYAQASLVLVDGAPLVWASWLFDAGVPERVAGSDLIPALLSSAQRIGRDLKLYFLGAAPGVGERAARAAEEIYQGVRVVGTFSPPLGFERDEAKNREIIDRIREAAPDVLIVGLGAPKQELWVYRHSDELKSVPVALCAGATIDFLAGSKARAPRWMRKVGVEWMHRVVTEPRRLAPRYASDALRFPQLVLREWLSRGR
jgi:N-acetylglucosaminyldiphosphoundecaprenol N-acetyl-beta-D-mannosaminyltransferase